MLPLILPPYMLNALLLFIITPPPRGGSLLMYSPLLPVMLPLYRLKVPSSTSTPRPYAPLPWVTLPWLLWQSVKVNVPPLTLMVLKLPFAVML